MPLAVLLVSLCFFLHSVAAERPQIRMEQSGDVLMIEIEDVDGDIQWDNSRIQFWDYGRERKLLPLLIKNGWFQMDLTDNGAIVQMKYSVLEERCDHLHLVIYDEQGDSAAESWYFSYS